MSASTVFQLFLLASAFLCTVTFGFVLIFTIVIMPGIGRLNDGDFLRAFQLIDGVIQDNQPVFVFTWIGAVLALIVTTGLGLSELDDNRHKILLTASCIVYLVGQVTTFTLNVPLNNVVKELEIQYLDVSAKKQERAAFEAKWNFWNAFRTVIFGIVSINLLILLLVEAF